MRKLEDNVKAITDLLAILKQTVDENNQNLEEFSKNTQTGGNFISYTTLTNISVIISVIIRSHAYFLNLSLLYQSNNRWTIGVLMYQSDWLRAIK